MGLALLALMGLTGCNLAERRTFYSWEPEWVPPPKIYEGPITGPDTWARNKG